MVEGKVKCSGVGCDAHLHFNADGIYEIDDAVEQLIMDNKWMNTFMDLYCPICKFKVCVTNLTPRGIIKTMIG